jgi:magnesium-transporting ATPase (P-type)
LRTLAVACRSLRDDEPITQDETAERDLTYLGMAGIIDPARPEARAAIALAVTAGIRTLMITGDHPRTAARIAADLGIPGADRPVLTGRAIAELDDHALRDAVEHASVYARVAPEHKLRIVDALHASGDIVAMTGTASMTLPR